MGAGLIIGKFNDVKIGHLFRYRKDWWRRQSVFTYIDPCSFSKKEYSLKLKMPVAAKPESFEI